MSLSLPCVYFPASSKFGNHSGSDNMQNRSTEYLQQASFILQQAYDDGTQGLQGLLYATEVRPLQSTPAQHKYLQTRNTSNNIQQT